MLARRAQGRRCRRGDHADAARRRAEQHRRDRAGPARAVRPPVHRGPARGGIPGLRIVTFGGADAADLPHSPPASPPSSPRVQTAARRRRDDRLHVGHDRQAEGRHALPPGPARGERDAILRRVLQPAPDDLFAGTPPLAFTFGLGALLLFPLRVGAATLLLEKATPAELADAIAAYGVTVLSTAPTAYRAMLAAGKARPAARPAPAGVGRRAPAAVDVAGLLRRDRCEDHRRHRQHGDAAHLRRGAPATRSRPGSTGTGGARLPRRCPRRTTASRCPTASPAGSRSRARPAAGT